ncbi:MAG: intradiol ring-cleavage dioxygenase [Trueperaceae bacterium]|nr:intradiol ring-cleavage dioxygenase [Trueperaceae bacterium]
MSDYHDLGLQTDVTMWTTRALDRRRVLQMGLAGIGFLVTGCSIAQDNSSGACLVEIPEETAGPYPADGSAASRQSLNVLENSGIVRSDIRTSLATGNTAEGLPLTINLQLMNAAGECAPLTGYAVYLWHCSREGKYSMYSSGVTDEDYLRGVQVADSEGKLSFESIFPGCYAGRWPHVHFEVYPSLDLATSAANKIHTSQLALPQDVCEMVYTSADGYSQSIRNLSQISLASDNVFRDGVTEQMATVTGSLEEGYSATLIFGVNA